MSKDYSIYQVPMPGIQLVREDYDTNLAYIRNSKRISQKGLADKSGVNVRMIQYYEQRVKDINKAQADTIYKLAKALNCSMEDIIEK